MSKRKILLLTAAAIVAMIVVIVVHSSMQPQQTVQAPVIQTTEIMAAARDMPTGTIVRESDLKWITWPTDAETSKLYVKGKGVEISGLAGGVLREGIHADEPIITGRIVQPHEQGFLAAVLTPGMRAMSVTLTPGGEVAGFIFPGDRVDVILAHHLSLVNAKGEKDNGEHALSETVVTDARILALDQKSDNQSTDPKVAQLATLEVTPAQAEKLALAVDMAGGTTGKGSLTLVLRSLAATVDNPGVVEKAAPTQTLDSDVSPMIDSVKHYNKVEVMRGKEKTDNYFPYQK